MLFNYFMKMFKLIIIILFVFLKTGNVLSETKIFDVNNIEIEKKSKISNEELANKAIKKGFIELLNKILLKKDINSLSTLKLTDIKKLVNYYQISSKTVIDSQSEKISFNISFDKNKVHNLFYKKGISYSEITNNELFILPVFKTDDKIYIYNKNFFYENWNASAEENLIEFILPLENIEIIQYINLKKDNLFDLELGNLFTEYSDENLALVIIELKNKDEEKIYFKTKIFNKNIVKNILIKRGQQNKEEFYLKIISDTKKEISDLIKSQNLIDIKTPSFLKAKLEINKKNNLVDLKTRLLKIESIEKIYVQEFNNESISIKIKYLGKLDKIIRQLRNQKIILQSKSDEWFIKLI